MARTVLKQKSVTYIYNACFTDNYLRIPMCCCYPDISLMEPLNINFDIKHEPPNTVTLSLTYYFIIFQGIVIASGVTYEPLKAELSNRVVVYPEWGNILGWMFVICAFLWVPSYAIYTVLGKYTMGKTWKQRLAMCISPEKEHKSILNGNEVKRFQVTIRLNVYRL